MTDPFDVDTTDIETTPPTQHYGFTRIGDGEGFDKNGWAFGDADRVKQDAILWALENHKHTGSPALGDPSDPPALTIIPTGGHLSPATTYYYRVAFVDEWGLETAASPETSVDTADAVPAPTAPSAAVEATSGTVSAGQYAYVITEVDPYGGETTASDSAVVVVNSGSSNRIRLVLPDLSANMLAHNIYRARPGQTQFYKLGTSVIDSFYDEGDAEDQTIVAPLINTTNSSNCIQVDIASGVVPLGATAWNIYRTDTSGDYSGNSLVVQVSEGATDTDTTPTTTYLDTGDVLLQGFPLASSSTIAAASVVDLGEIQGHLPLAALPRGSQCITAAAAGALSAGEVVTVTDAVTAVRPTRFTAFLRTPPTSGSITVRAADNAGTTLDLVCTAANHRSSDPAGLWRLAFPTTDAGTYQAESGDRSDTDVVQIVTDLAAVSGQAVQLTTTGQWVQIPLGALDPGTYDTVISARSATPNGSTAHDLTIAAIRTDTNATLATTVVATTAGTFTTPIVGPTFTAPGGAPVVLRVTYTGNSGETYNVDSETVTPQLVTLAAGLITISVPAVDGGASGSDLNVALWF